MHSNEAISGVYSLLNSTPEGGLRKMLVGGEFAEVHFRLLMKMAKGPSEADFISSFNAETLPAMRYSPAEIKVKETFWKICKNKFSSLGLLNISAKAA